MAVLGESGTSVAPAMLAVIVDTSTSMSSVTVAVTISGPDTIVGGVVSAGDKIVMEGGAAAARQRSR